MVPNNNGIYNVTRQRLKMSKSSSKLEEKDFNGFMNWLYELSMPVYLLMLFAGGILFVKWLLEKYL